MRPAIGGYQILEELHTEALVVVYRAAREGQEGHYALRLYRNPAASAPEKEWAARCAARLAALELQRAAHTADPQRFAPIHALGRCDEGVYDVTDFAPLTAADLIHRRVLLTPRQLHRLITGVVDASLALKSAHDRAHAAIRAGRVLVDTPAIEWTSAIRLIDPAPGAHPDASARADLRAIGELLYALITHRRPDIDASMQGVETPGLADYPRRLAARWRRLCDDLLDAPRAGDAITLEKAAARVRALKPPSPGQARLRAAAGAAVGVAAVAGVGWYLVSTDRQQQREAAQVPGKLLFFNAKDAAIALQRSLSAPPPGSPLERLARDAAFTDALNMLSVRAMLDERAFSQWFSASRSRVTAPGADEHDLIDWRKAPAQQWWDAIETVKATLTSAFVEPLNALADAADTHAWRAHAAEARRLRDLVAQAEEPDRLPQIVPELPAAARSIAQLETWTTEMRDARARHEQVIERIAATRAAAVSPQGEQTPIAQLAAGWLETLSTAQRDDEQPTETIERYRDVGAVVLEEIADAANYWNTTPEFKEAEFLAESPRVELAGLDPAQARSELEKWARSVQDGQFLDIGADPRAGLLAQREDLQREIETLLGSLDEGDRAAIDAMVGQVRDQLASVEQALEGLGAWSVESERPVRDAVAAGRTRLTAARDRWTDTQNFLQERQNIEARRQGVIARAESLAGEHSEWIGPLLAPRIDAARSAQGEALPPRLDELDEEVQRLRDVVRANQAMAATVGRLESDARTVGAVFAHRGRDLLALHRAQAPADAEAGRALEARVEGLVALRDQVTTAMTALEARTPLSADNGALAQRAQDILSSLAEMEIDPAQVAEQGRAFRVLAELRPYLGAQGDWAALRDRLAQDLPAGAMRSESLWHAYALLRDAERAQSPALSMADIELERQARARLVAAYQTLAPELAEPALAMRVERWLAPRPASWETNAQALRDAQTAAQAVAGAAVDPGATPALASGALLVESLSYTPPEEDDETGLAQVAAFRARAADLRSAHPGDSPWYRVLEDLEQRLGALADGEAGPTLTPELLAQAGPALRGWALSPDSTVEAPVYTRGDASIAFILVETDDTPVFLARDELSLHAFEAVALEADDNEWQAITTHAIYKNWGAEPDFQQQANLTRGYFIDANRRVSTQGDWLAPHASVTGGGAVNWGEHWRLAYEEDAARAPRWAPTPATPLHMVGFPAAVAVARAAGCRLPTPDEWRAALADESLRDGDVPNVSDATWLRQMGRISSFIPSPTRGAFFAQGAGEQPDLYSTDDDGWLWPRPVGTHASAPIRDLVGNVAEWADARAREREGAFDAAVFTNEEVDASARIMGVSALSASGQADQEIALRPRGRRAQGFADRLQAMRTGFADVGVRLAFDVGDVRPKSLAARYAEELSGVAAAAQQGGGG